MRKLIEILTAIDAHLSEISGCLVYLCHLAEKESQKREKDPLEGIL